MQKLVSVIIPVYNKELYLKNSLSSVINQTYKKLEIIIINDGSTDGSEELILEFIKKDARIIYLSNINGGVASARNKGIKEAKGHYVTFLDPDDFYNHDFIEKMVHYIGDGPICYCGNYLLDASKPKRKSPMKFVENDIIEQYFLNVTAPLTNSWLFKREFILEHQITFDETMNWGEDVLFFSKLLTMTQSVRACKHYLTNYTLGVPNSLSSNNIDKIEKDIYCINQYMEFLNSVTMDATRKARIISAIEGYRLPALVIFRLYLNKELLTKELYKKYLPIIKKMKFNNGLRSIKLTIYRMLLAVQIKIS